MQSDALIDKVYATESELVEWPLLQIVYECELTPGPFFYVIEVAKLNNAWIL